MNDKAQVTILLVEDEAPVRRFLRAALPAHGYKLLEAVSVAEGTVLATSHRPDLILMDLGLPDGDGIDFTRRIREWSDAPIIVISARGQEEDKVRALDAGADDYLTKPFGTGELLARIRVALRHASARKNDTPPQPRYLFGDVEIDLERREVRRAGELLHLTPTEYGMLILLAKNAGRVLTHRQILQEVWGSQFGTQSHHVRVHMAELRKKIEDVPARPKLIVTEPGVGYRLRASQDETAEN
jgi:two-component system, OmpR family, KDP operon response regulator KdpE